MAEPTVTAAEYFSIEVGDGVADRAAAADMQRAYCQTAAVTDSHPRTWSSAQRAQLDHGGGGAGGGGPSTGTVIGGSPGIWTTVEPISGGMPGKPGIPSGGGGGAGAMPLET